MKFLVDAQLPRRLARWLSAHGHDAIHTLDLPSGNRTSDPELCRIADHQERVVVTKDEDFVFSYMISATPARLLRVSTGNISNDELLKVLASQLDALVQAFSRGRYIEITHDALLIHE